MNDDDDDDDDDNLQLEEEEEFDYDFVDYSSDDSQFIDNEDYALLGKALTVKSKLEEATIETHQQIMQQMQQQHSDILNSALFTVCSPYATNKAKYKRECLNSIMNTIENVNNDYEMNCRCSVLDRINKKWNQCSTYNCKASYHEKCIETIDNYCVKCTLNLKRQHIKSTYYIKRDQNILFRLTFTALDLLQCVIQFLSFLDYTKFKITSKILYRKLVCSTARYGVYSIDISDYVLRHTTNCVKILKYWQKCVKHITVPLYRQHLDHIWKLFPKLKKVISLSINGQRGNYDKVIKQIMYGIGAVITWKNIEKIQFKLISINYEHVLSNQFWNILSSSSISQLTINDLNIPNYPQYEDILHNIDNLKKQIHQKRFSLIKCLALRNLRPYTMMYLLLHFCQENLQKLTIDFNPFYNTEPSLFIPPTKISYQFNNLKFIRIYSYCSYKKFTHLFKSSLKSLEYIHICDNHEDDFDDNDSDGLVSYPGTGNWFMDEKQKHKCLIHLLLTTAPKLHTIKIDVPMLNDEFLQFCNKINENKKNIKKLREIRLCIYENIPSVNEDDYKWLIQGVKLLILSFADSPVWNIIIELQVNPTVFQDFKQELKEQIVNYLTKIELIHHQTVEFFNIPEIPILLRLFYHRDLINDC